MRLSKVFYLIHFILGYSKANRQWEDFTDKVFWVFFQKLRIPEDNTTAN